MQFNQKQQIKILKIAGLSLIIPFFLVKCLYTVGHMAIKFNKFFGLKDNTYRQGWHLRIPFFQVPILYNAQNRKKQITAQTANRGTHLIIDMQMIKISVSVLYHPQIDKLSWIHNNLGPTYDQKVLPPIVNQIMRSVVAQYSASQLLTQRDQVSDRIKTTLQQRAKQFNIIINNVAIKELNFGTEYSQAVQSKQVAQQEAQRAKFYVEQAKEARKSIIIKAQAEARSIELVGSAAMKSPYYLQIRRIEFAKQLANILAQSRNHVLLNSQIIMPRFNEK